jgi:hypothetical protein
MFRLVREEFGAKDAVELCHRQVGFYKVRLCGRGFQEDNAALSIRIPDIPSEVVYITSIMTASKEDLSALDVVVVMMQHLYL